MSIQKSIEELLKSKDLQKFLAKKKVRRVLKEVKHVLNSDLKQIEKVKESVTNSAEEDSQQDQQDNQQDQQDNSSTQQDDLGQPVEVPQGDTDQQVVSDTPISSGNTNTPNTPNP
jgi:ABC-type Zn2+ transport system substrate-binding protein/surface adhesin